jgi:branched-chain amino acid transport system permease protein
MDLFDPLINDFWTYTFTGLIQGAIYALVALGYTLVYGVLRLINFAHSEVFMVGTFAAIFALRTAGLGADEAVPTAAVFALYLVIAVIAGGVASGLTAVVVERVAYRPLRNGDASILIMLIGAIGLSFVLSRSGLPAVGKPAFAPLAVGLLAAFAGVIQLDRRVLRPRGRALTFWPFVAATMAASIVLLVVLSLILGVGGGSWAAALISAVVLAALIALALRWEEQGRPRRGGAPTLVFLISAIGASFVLSETFGLWQGRNNVRVGNLIDPKPVISFGTTRIDNRQVLILVAAVAMMVALDQFLLRTRLGRGVRAVAQNPDAAALMGVNADRVIALTFLLGGLMAGVAAVLYDLQFGVTRYDAGFLLGIKAFTAAVLGGIGNLRGALLGGLLLGLMENWGSAVIGAQWRDVVAFVFLILVLMFRPTGVLGESLGRARA